MSYIVLLRELQTRLKLHAVSGGMLDGLRIERTCQYRIDGDSALPQFTIIDLEGQAVRGKASGVISGFLTTARRDGLFSETDDAVKGAIDWLELIMDAVETAPSTMGPDTVLTAHNADGTPRLKNGLPYELLLEPFTWSFRAAEITDESIKVQLDIAYSVAEAKRGRRRTTPFEKSPV